MPPSPSTDVPNRTSPALFLSTANSPQSRHARPLTLNAELEIEALDPEYLALSESCLLGCLRRQGLGGQQHETWSVSPRSTPALPLDSSCGPEIEVPNPESLAKTNNAILQI